MRTRRVLLCLACSICWSQSEQPPKALPGPKTESTESTQAEKTANKKQTPSTDQSTVKKIPSPDPNKNTAENKTSEELNINWRIATYTGVLALVGILQLIALIVQARIFFVTLKENRKAIEATGRAADAAKQSADITQRSFILTQRPKIVIRKVLIEREDQLFPANLMTASVVSEAVQIKGSFHIVNIGGTKAHISWISSRVIIGGRLPRDHFGAFSVGPRRAVNLEPGQFHIWRFPDEDPSRVGFGPERIQAVQSARTNLYVTGVIGYRDEAGVHRQSAFGRKWDHDTRRFVPVDDPDYESAD